MTNPNDFLAHYGVKGMKWGVRRRSGNKSSESSGRAKSQDHLDAQVLKKKRLSELSNSDLKKLNERMQLEQNYSQLMGKQATLTKGRKYAKSVLAVAKTGQEVYNVVNSPAGKAVRQMLAETK